MNLKGHRNPISSKKSSWSILPSARTPDFDTCSRLHSHGLFAALRVLCPPHGPHVALRHQRPSHLQISHNPGRCSVHLGWTELGQRPEGKAGRHQQSHRWARLWKKEQNLSRAPSLHPLRQSTQMRELGEQTSLKEVRDQLE